MITKKTLSNGITVVLEYLPYVQSATIGVWTKAGAVDEKEHPGISHFIEHMMFKGTNKRSAMEIAADIDSIGGNMNAFTSSESTCYYIKTQSIHLDTTIDVLSDMLTDSLFDTKEMDKEKGVVIEEYNMIEDSPEDLGEDLIKETVFKGASLGNSVIGTKDSISNYSRENIIDYIAERYSADNMVISVAGNFDEDEIIKMLEAGFRSIPASGKNRISILNDFTPEKVNRKKDIEQAHIFFGKRGTSFTSDDYYSYLLYNSILGGGMSSRLFQSIREDKGLAYSVYSSNHPYVDDGLFVIYAGVGGGKVDEASAAIEIELRKIADEGIKKEELDKVKEQNKGHYIFGRENISSRMFSAGRNTLLLGKTFSEEEIIAGINDVTVDDIIRIAKQNADFSDYSQVIIDKGEK